MDSFAFIARRIQKRWDDWCGDDPDTEDMPQQHIQDLESLAAEWMNEHRGEIDGTAEPESEPKRLIQDDDCHWYVIPVYREDDFRDWCKSMAECLDWTHEWEPTRVDGPHTVQFYEWDE